MYEIGNRDPGKREIARQGLQEISGRTERIMKVEHHHPPTIERRGKRQKQSVRSAYLTTNIFWQPNMTVAKFQEIRIIFPGLPCTENARAPTVHDAW